MSQKNTIVLHVDHMTCPNCELRIEQKLKEMPGIFTAKASYANGWVNISYDPLSTQETQMQELLTKLGYPVKSISPLAARERKKSKEWFILLGIAFGIVLILLLLNQFIALDITAIEPKMGFGALLVIGLITSLHCITMCGGINISLCMTYKKNHPQSPAFLAGFLYNLGRVISYTTIGGIVGALGSVINVSSGIRGVGAFLAGGVMVIMGLNMLNIFTALRKYIPKMPKIFGSKIYNGIGKSSPFLIGLLNGLMPCGPLQSIQLYALGTGSAVLGACSMFLFSLGTVPAVFGYGALSSLASKKFTAKMMMVSAILVLILGAMMLMIGLRSIMGSV